MAELILVMHTLIHTEHHNLEWRWSRSVSCYVLFVVSFFPNIVFCHSMQTILTHVVRILSKNLAH